MIRANLILKAAANLFAEQGYDSVSINEIGPGWLTSSVNLAGLPAISMPAGNFTKAS